LKILKFSCLRTRILCRFWNSGCFSTQLGFF